MKLMHKISMKAVICSAALMVLVACQHEVRQVSATEPVDDTACVLDGMLLKSFAGPKAQIVYADGSPDFFCNVMELFENIFSPQSKRRIAAIYVQDAGKTDWEHPQGNWIEAKAAFYVVGSKKSGAMGATFASFSVRQDAETFSGKEGGKVVRFDQITPDMLNMSNSAKSDVRM